MRWPLIVVFSILMFSGCGSPAVQREQTAAPIPVAPPPEPTLQLPGGWVVLSGADDGAKRFADSGGGMRLSVKELIPVGAAKEVLDAERMCLLAQLSLQGRIASGVTDRRVLHLPESIDGKNELCYYVYTDGALLRRVVVYRALGRYYESEMQQRDQTLLLSQLAESQGAVIRSLVQYLESKDSITARHSINESHTVQQH
jgi:hypothetical protein